LNSRNQSKVEASDLRVARNCDKLLDIQIVTEAEVKKNTRFNKADARLRLCFAAPSGGPPYIPNLGKSY
jgi:hypothetical protein